MRSNPIARHGTAAVLLASALALALSLVADPARTDPIALKRSTIDGGGVSFVQGGSFTLGATIGQPDAGWLAARSFTLLGGFWWGGGSLVGVGDDPSGPTNVPLAFRLFASAPNPLSTSTRVAFDLPDVRPVSLKIYSVDGRLVRSLVDQPMPAGHHAVTWDASDDHGRRVPSGVYLLKLEAGHARARHKLAVLR
jgi:hypothetical protein